MLPFAISIAISPMPIVAMVLMLVTPKAKTNGFAFLLGWLIGILAIGAIALVVINPGRSSDSDGKATWVSSLELALGLLLLHVAVRRGARARTGARSPPPRSGSARSTASRRSRRSRWAPCSAASTRRT